jgi:hypothetical protein
MQREPTTRTPRPSTSSPCADSTTRAASLHELVCRRRSSLPGAAASILNAIGCHEPAREAATRACPSPSCESPRRRGPCASVPAAAASILHASGLHKPALDTATRVCPLLCTAIRSVDELHRCYQLMKELGRVRHPCMLAL